jgi:hypothetical protein
MKKAAINVARKNSPAEAAPGSDVQLGLVDW